MMITQDELEELANEICDEQFQIERECETIVCDKRYSKEDKTGL